MTLCVTAGDEVLVATDPPLWLRAAGSPYVDGDGVEWVPFRMRSDGDDVPPRAVLASLVLRIRKAEEVVARRLME